MGLEQSSCLWDPEQRDLDIQYLLNQYDSLKSVAAGDWYTNHKNGHRVCKLFRVTFDPDSNANAKELDRFFYELNELGILNEATHRRWKTKTEEQVLQQQEHDQRMYDIVFFLSIIVASSILGEIYRRSRKDSHKN